MFGKRITLFELFGFKVKVDMSWALLALLIAWSLAQGFFPSYYEGLPAAVYWWMGIAGAVGLFLSIVIHELAHSLVARRLGIPIKGITLFIFGGVAEMEEEPAAPAAEFWMAIAGPLASLLLAALFWLGAQAAGEGLPQPVTAVLRYLALLNALLAGFNLLPAFPLDGGRMLRAVLWWRSGDLRRATRIAARVGTAFGFGLMGLGLLNALGGNLVGGIWWILIGLFLTRAAAGSWQQMMLRRSLEGEKVRRFMTADPVAVPPDISVAALVEEHVYRSHHDLYPVVEGGRPVGTVTLRRIRELPRERWADTPVSEIAAPCTAQTCIEAGEDAMHALSLMQRSGNSRLLVTEGGRLVGILALKDIMTLLALRMDLEGRD